MALSLILLDQANLEEVGKVSKLQNLQRKQVKYNNIFEESQISMNEILIMNIIPNNILVRPTLIVVEVRVKNSQIAPFVF